jgi:hypothetical protein
MTLGQMWGQMNESWAGVGHPKGQRDASSSPGNPKITRAFPACIPSTAEGHRSETRQNAELMISRNRNLGPQFVLAFWNSGTWLSSQEAL